MLFRDARRRSALTLVEVVAALALLAVMLAGVTTARSRLVQQWSRADRVLSAVEAADILLAAWYESNGPSEVHAGRVGDFAWAAAEVRERGAEALGLRVVRLELFDPTRSREPLVTVDTVWDLEPLASEVARAE